MVHDTRIIPLDGRPHIGSGIRQLMGDSRGHWEGNTLVIETTNFTDRTAVGANGGGPRHSAAMKMTERITRIDPQMINYELRIDDPKTYVAPWTLRMTMTQQPGYEIYEYGCHEGNGAVAQLAHRRARLREGGRRERGEGPAASRARVRARQRRRSRPVACDGEVTNNPSSESTIDVPCPDERPRAASRERRVEKRVLRPPLSMAASIELTPRPV